MESEEFVEPGKVYRKLSKTFPKDPVYGVFFKDGSALVRFTIPSDPDPEHRFVWYSAPYGGEWVLVNEGSEQILAHFRKAVQNAVRK